MNFTDLHIPPPDNWPVFEELCRALFAAIWNDSGAALNGRQGQPQCGVDVYGRTPERPGQYRGVQCKGKNRNYGSKATTREFDAELVKAETFKPGLVHWTFATTAPTDGKLQEHVRLVSAARVAKGQFPVDVMGWDALQSMLAQHPSVIEQFYPLLGPQLPLILARLDKLPGEVLAAVRTSPPQTGNADWMVETFSGERDLGPALLGRPLGPADVDACPELPQVGRLWDELAGGYSARVLGSPGAGKSVCAFQVARRAHARGWRVLRLRNPQTSQLELVSDGQPTLFIVDDAHLTDPALLRRAEEQTSASRWLLSAHTVTEDQTPSAGIIRIDPKQAVSVIAAGLRVDMAETLRVVQKVDDRVGDHIGDEPIEHRIEAAEAADRPWQFCFILGGGWQRASQSAHDARAAGFDIFLAIAALHQIASRDARASLADLGPLLSAAGLEEGHDAAIDWLVNARLLLSRDDLRCPHQRLSIVLIRYILEGQDQARHKAVAAAIGVILADPTYPFVGLYILLQELRMTGGNGHRWHRLVEQNWLPPLIARCWAAEDALDRRGAAFLLTELQSYYEREAWLAAILLGYEETAARWYSEALPETGYSLGSLFGQIRMKDEALAQSVVALADPEAVAAAVSHRDTVAACDAASMVYHSAGCRPDTWCARYLAAIDRDNCLEMMRNWPRDHYLSAAGTFCQIFTWDDEAFGLDLIEALIPRIADELRTNPVHGFHELHDMIWLSLRLRDLFGTHIGKNAPTRRMREIGKKMVAIWEPKTLAAQLTAIGRREFQPAGWLLLFVRERSVRRFETIVVHIDWPKLEATIGDAWARSDHDIEVFLQICFQAKKAQEPIRQMIAANRTRQPILSVRLAMLAPQVAIEQLETGGAIGLAKHGHFHWRMSAAVIAQLAIVRSDIIEAMVTPHEAIASEKLSGKTQPFFGEPLLFLRLLRQLAPASFERILAAIDPVGAETGWGAALSGMDAAHHASKGDRETVRDDRQTAAWLVEIAHDRTDALGEVARRLRQRYPRRSVPPVKLLESFGDADPVEAQRAEGQKLDAPAR